MPKYTQEQVDAMPKIPCECGCGTVIPAWSTKRQIPRRFAQGHYLRVNKIVHTTEHQRKTAETRRRDFLAQFPDGVRECTNCHESYELARFFIKHKKKHVAVCQFCRRSADAAIKRAERAQDPMAYRIKVACQAYGITEEHAYRLLTTDRCAICGATAHHIDHDHITGRVRERLCSKCNQGLGSFDDSPEKLAAAMTYLLKHTEIHQLDALVKETSHVIE